MKKGITVHTIIKNEEQWVWYAIKSVLQYVDQVLIYDTGSTDRTREIINKIKDKKMIVKKKYALTKQQITELRNEQIRETQTNWFMLLDGDEVWPTNTILELVERTRKAPAELFGMVTRAVIPIGDLFHYQPEEAGRYSLLGKAGHMNIRAYRALPGYRWSGKYPNEAYISTNGVALQEQDENLVMMNQPYWHMTHLVRSSVDVHHKRKLEIGVKRNIRLPEVFYLTRPTIVPSPWVFFSSQQKAIAQLITPLLHLKRKV